MLNRKLRVLSIDFDFFQNVDKDTMRYCYPDGVDLPTHLSTIVWGSKYSIGYKCVDKIKAVTIDVPLFSAMLNILDKQESDTPMLIAQSHVSIYDFIHKYAKMFNGVSIVNIDMHHDLFNDNPELDCGNWLMHIANDFENRTFNWITREVAVDCYGIKPEDNLKTEFDLSKIQDAEFDIIFLCRSDNWLPPHLDEWFDKMLKFCTNKFTNVVGEKCILKPRDLSGIIEAEDEIFRKMMYRTEAETNANNHTVTE